MRTCKWKQTCKAALSAAKRPVLAFLLALITGGIMIAISGYNPFWVYYRVFALAFSSPKNIASVFAQATPLMFSGIGYAIAAKCGLVNLGLEGQMLSGAMTSALLGAYLKGLPMIIHLPIAVLGGALAGAFVGGLTAFLKNRFGAREIITTVMLNEIIALLVSYLCNGPFRAEGSIWGMTEQIQDSAVIGKLMKNTQLTYAIFLAIFLGILLEFILKKSTLGYKMQVIGPKCTRRQAALRSVPDADRPEKVLGPRFGTGSGRSGRLGRFHPQSPRRTALGNRDVTASGRALVASALHREETLSQKKLHVAGDRAGDRTHPPDPASVLVSRFPNPRRCAVRFRGPFRRTVRG